MTRTADRPLDAVARAIGKPARVASPSPVFRVSKAIAADPDGRAVVAGRGLTRHAADARCLGEAAEFLSLRWTEAAARLERSNRDVPVSSTIEVAAILGPESAGSQLLPVPADRYGLVAVRPLNGGPARWAPSALVYRGHPDGRRYPALALAGSTGAAAGRTHASAVRAALFELVERDAVAVWWRDRLRRPPVPPAARDHRAIRRLAADLAARGRMLLLIDLTHDLRVPVVAAVSARRDGSWIGIGTAAAPALRQASLAAAGELVQILAGIDAPLAEGPIGEREARALPWLEGANLRALSYLVPSSAAMAEPEPPRANRSRILKTLAARGIHVYAHDCSRAELGVPVVKLLAPGLRSLGKGRGPGRRTGVPPDRAGGLCENANPWVWPF